MRLGPDISTIDYHYQTIGQVLVFLINKGLARIHLEAADAMTIMTFRRGDEEEVLKTFSDCLHWMLSEGLIRAKNVEEFDGGYFFSGVQLTSLGIHIIQQETGDPEIGPTIEESAKKKSGADLDASKFTKIGAFVGGALGGLIKSIS